MSKRDFYKGGPITPAEDRAMLGIIVATDQQEAMLKQLISEHSLRIGCVATSEMLARSKKNTSDALDRWSKETTNENCERVIFAASTDLFLSQCCLSNYRNAKAGAR